MRHVVASIACSLTPLPHSSGTIRDLHAAAGSNLFCMMIMIYALWSYREEFSRVCYSFGSTPDMDPVPGNDSSPANFLYPEHFRVSQGVSVKLDSSCIDASFATVVHAPCKQKTSAFLHLPATFFTTAQEATVAVLLALPGSHVSVPCCSHHVSTMPLSQTER